MTNDPHTHFNVGAIVDVLSKKGTQRWVRCKIAMIEHTPNGDRYTVESVNTGNFFYAFPDHIRKPKGWD